MFIANFPQTCWLLPAGGSITIFILLPEPFLMSSWYKRCFYVQSASLCFCFPAVFLLHVDFRQNSMIKNITKYFESKHHKTSDSDWKKSQKTTVNSWKDWPVLLSASSTEPQTEQVVTKKEVPSLKSTPSRSSTVICCWMTSYCQYTQSPSRDLTMVGEKLLTLFMQGIMGYGNRTHSSDFSCRLSFRIRNVNDWNRTNGP